MEILMGPNISSGVENLDIRYSNPRASLKHDFSRLATIDFAVPGSPSIMILSPASAAISASATSVSFSYIPHVTSDSRCSILSLRIIISSYCYLLNTEARRHRVITIILQN